MYCFDDIERSSLSARLCDATSPAPSALAINITNNVGSVYHERITFPTPRPLRFPDARIIRTIISSDLYTQLRIEIKIPRSLTNRNDTQWDSRAGE
jgi:hypothetical protein